MRLKSLLGIMATIAVVSACAGPTTAPSSAAASQAASEPPPSGAASPSTAELAPGTIKWWLLTPANETATAAQLQMATDFEALHPGVKVEVETRDVDAHKEALRQALGTPATPDVYFMWAGLGLGGEFVNAGGSQDLTSYYEQYGWEDRFIGPALAAVTQYGGYHGVPWVAYNEVIYYLKDAFQNAGITALPTTYDELIAANDKLKAAGVSPIQFGGTVNWHLMRLLDNLLELKCGAEKHDGLKAMTTSWATEPCVTEAFVELKKWADNYLQDNFIAVDNDESSALFYAGDAAMALEGNWFVGNVREFANEDNVGLLAFPTGNDRLYGFVEAQYISSNSEVKDQAAAFLDFISSPETQQKHLGTFSSQSVTNGVTKADQTSLEQAWDPILAKATGVFMNGDQALPLDATTEYWRIQNLVATGELDPAQAGAEFQKFIDNRPS